jgi:hypothetical protein
MSDLTIVEFLRARLYAEAQVARVARGKCSGVWTQTDPDRAPGRIEDEVGVIVYDEGSPSKDEGAHIALQDPQHTIAGIQAARKVLDMYEEAEVAVRPSDEGEEDYFDGVRLGLYVAVVALAGRYSSHPDFNADWDMGTQVGGKLDGYLR